MSVLTNQSNSLADFILKQTKAIKDTGLKRKFAQRKTTIICITLPWRAQKADWLVGLNVTRALTGAKYQDNLSAGRVQTPTFSNGTPTRKND